METKKDILLMSKKERQRYHLLEKVMEGFITLKEASELMNVSYRQAKRIKKSFLEGGAKGLLHGNRGRHSGNKLPEEIREKILCLSKERYSDFNDVHFKEKLEEAGIQVSLSTVRSIRRNNGIEPKRKRRSKRYFGRRERKDREGVMVQWDGSPHKWFGKENPSCCLMAGVDDSTGKIVGAFFIEKECSLAYFKLLEMILKRNGIPLSIYQDRHSALKRNDKNWTLEEQLKGKQNPTQVGVVLEELGIKAKFAYTPQAKGRIERLFGVLQDRLTAELNLQGINNIKEANIFLEKEFIKTYNNRFAIKAKSSIKAWRKKPNNKELIKTISFRYNSVVGNDNTVRIGGKFFTIPEGKNRRGYAKAIVDVRQLLDGSWRIYYKGELLLKQKESLFREPIRAIARQSKCRAKATSSEEWAYRASSV